MKVKPIGLSLTETAKTLGGADDPLGRTTIWRMVKRGELEAIKLGSRTLITTASLDRLMENAPRVAAS